MRIRFLPLVMWENGARVPKGKRASVLVDVGRLSVAVGFWRFSNGKLPTFTYRLRAYSARGGMVRVWRVLVGFVWRQAE